MRYQLAISPDVHARDLSSWFLLNTRLQRLTGHPSRATVYDDFAALHAAFDTGHVDLVYANAADTALLVRHLGYRPIAKLAGVADEAAVIVADESPLLTLDDVGGPLRVAATDAPDVERICRILLEPADVGVADIALSTKRNYILVAKAVLNGEVDAGFFLREAYDALSDLTRRRLRILISSQIYVVSHCLLASPQISQLVEPICEALETITKNPADQDLLAGLGSSAGWERTTPEDIEFVIDLMDALDQ
jgi:phosphonate transport system substrate-binding protein